MTKTSILVAEDKDFLQKIVAANLPKEFNSILASNWSEALEKASGADAAIISMNIAGPGSESLLTAIKKIKNIPVVCLTSNMTSTIRIKLLKEGADDVVTKPFNPEELTLRLLRLLK